MLSTEREIDEGTRSQGETTKAMALSISSERIWLYSGSVDFRQSIDGLSALVLSHFSDSLHEGVFIFLNRRQNRLKVLAWHGNGFVVIYKRLERGRFKFSFDEALPNVSLDSRELSWLLAGLDWQAMGEWRGLNYENIV